MTARPTRFGVKAIVFYAVLVGAYFAAPYSNLFFLLVAFLTVLGGMEVLALLRRGGPPGELADPGPMPAGVPIPLSATANATRGAHLVLDLAGERAVNAGPLRPAADGVATALLPARTRGIAAIRGAWLAVPTPLGFFTRRRRLAAPADLAVHPAPADLAEKRGGGAGPGDRIEHHASRAGLVQPSGLREYRPGDEIRRIHHKASARRRVPVIAEWDGGGGSGMEVVLDRRAAPDAFEPALSLLAALANAAADAEQPLTLHTQGLSATFGGVHRPRTELLRFLAGVEPLPAGAAPPPPAPPDVLRLPRNEGRR